ncbi:thiol reductant ABC exporter subunit CydD [Roseibium sp. MMSF_3544]|uniref:thiol reductant ABC exporter subunit CydD n=1 Tax=unclassified Roseibium TaxID=2629323 RepID=UPI00353184DD
MRGLKTNTISGVEIGGADSSEKRTLGRAGVVLALSDFLWIPQAGLIAWTLGSILSAVADPETNLEVSGVMPLLLTSAAGVIAIALLRVVLQTVAQNTSRRVAQAIQQRARTDLLKATVVRSPADSFPASGAFAAHVTDQVNLLGPYYTNYLPQFMRLKLVPLAIVLVTAWFSWMAALILLVSGPLIPVFMALIGSRAKTASAEQQEELTRLSGMLLDRIKGLETLRVFGALERTKSDIREAGERFRLGTMKVLKVAFLSSTVLELFSALGIAFSAVFVGFSLLGDIQVGVWNTPLGYVEGLFILLLAPEFFAPLRAFSAAYHERAAGLAARQKLSDLLQSIGPAAAVSERVLPKRESTGSTIRAPRISFDGVSISLDGRQILSKVDLELAPGETLLITGPSGSGKTTLLDCVLGFRTPDSGSVRMDDKHTQEVAHEFRQNVMWLGQAPQLFHGTLKSNLLKGVSDPQTVSESEIWRALRLAGAEALAQRLPRGLDTPLGENGFGLSVGEIRRVALARAAMRKQATILLADEPTAGLDEETAVDVIDGLRLLKNSRTTIIATHDPAVLKIGGRRIDLDGSGIAREPEVVP